MGAPSYLSAGAAHGPMGQMNALGYGYARVLELDVGV